MPSIRIRQYTIALNENMEFSGGTSYVIKITAHKVVPFQLKLASIQTFKSRNGKLSCFVLPAIFSKKHIND